MAKFLKDSSGRMLTSLVGGSNKALASSTDGGGSPPVLTAVFKINLGSNVSVGDYVAGISTNYHQTSINYDYGSITNNLSAQNSAPNDVYNTMIYNAQGIGHSVIIPLNAGLGLVNGQQHIIRLHFSDGMLSSYVGQRMANYSLNGTQVLTNFDIYALAGNAAALVREFTVTADANGINVSMIGVAGSSRMCGIEIYRYI